MKVIWLPLGIMLLLSFVSVAYVQAVVSGSVIDNPDDFLTNSGHIQASYYVKDALTQEYELVYEGDTTGWADTDGRLICYENLTLTADAAGDTDGILEYGIQGYYRLNEILLWKNSSGSYSLVQVFSHEDILEMQSYDGAADTIKTAREVNESSVTFMVAQQGFIVAFLVGGIAMFFALGLNVLGSGLNTVGTKVVGTLIVFGGLWVIVSSFAIVGLTGGVVNGVVISGIPMLGWLIYLFLTFVYTMGVYGMVSGT